MATERAAVFVGGEYLAPPYVVGRRGGAVHINRVIVARFEGPRPPDRRRGPRERLLALLGERYRKWFREFGEAYALRRLHTELRDVKALALAEVVPGAARLEFKDGSKEELLLIGTSRIVPSATNQASAAVERIHADLAAKRLLLFGRGYTVTEPADGELRRRLVQIASRHQPAREREASLLEAVGESVLAETLREG